MPLTISLQFPAGRYVAAGWTDRDAVEWPPHPARLCLGLVDVLHKAGNPGDLRSALERLCALGPPAIVIPSDKLAQPLAMGGYFVPQNPDVAEQVIKHPRKPRSFPSVCLDPDQEAVFFHWPEAILDEGTLLALGRLVSALPRFGHSHSLVIAKVTENSLPDGEDWRTLVPAPEDHPGSPDFSLRVPYEGLLGAAEAAFQAEARAEEMAGLIEKAAIGANSNRTLKPATSPRGRHDPPRRWNPYLENLPSPVPGPPWDSRILVLKRSAGRLGLTSTWQLTTIFHRALLDRWERVHGPDAIPEWLSGHLGDEAGLHTGPARSCHLAAFPLANVGYEHSTGDLLGVALALPDPVPLGMERAAFRLQWRKALAALFGEDGWLALSPKDQAWTIELTPDDSPDPRAALRPFRWTRPSHTWHSVTPVILDRHPKPHFTKDPIAWAESCRIILAEACSRLGLPAPVEIAVSPHSPLRGVPPAFAFEAPEPRPGRPARFHIHATLRFAVKIRGPLLLGAGRYRGYGLFAPASDSPA